MFILLSYFACVLLIALNNILFDVLLHYFKVLKITNITSSKILFKVKTTQPTWYYVRPNQQVISAGQSEDVAILMVEAECK
jgi:hypothetical protein